MLLKSYFVLFYCFITNSTQVMFVPEKKIERFARNPTMVNGLHYRNMYDMKSKVL